MSERSTDGRPPSVRDAALAQYFAKWGISPLEAVRNFPMYCPEIWAKRFLAHYHLFQHVRDIPGDIAELGVFRGVGLLQWALFLEVHNRGDRQTRVYGFENWKGFTTPVAQDGGAAQEGGFNGGEFREMLNELLQIVQLDQFCPQKPRIVLVDGDIEMTARAFPQRNLGVRFRLIHFDCDMYAPTRSALEHLAPLLVPGGLLLFDEYAIPPWEGETKAVDEWLAEQGGVSRLHRLPWSANPGAVWRRE